MTARRPAPPKPKEPPRTTTRCSCGVSKHPDAAQVDAELRLVGQSPGPDSPTLTSIGLKYGLETVCLSTHRIKHMGLAGLRRGRPGVHPPLPPVPSNALQEAARPPQRAKQEPLPPTPEGVHAQLVKTLATLVSLGRYHGTQTVRALAARHGVDEAEVLRAHRRAALSVRDARGSLGAQLELSTGYLAEVRDREGQVADDYAGVAARIMAPAMPDPQTGRAPTVKDPTTGKLVPVRATQDQLDRARTARSISAQARELAVACQRQIDANTIHRRTAPIVQVSFSANPEFANAQEGLVLVLGAFVGPAQEASARASVARGLALLEDAGGCLDAPEFLEYLSELRADAGALVVEADAAE